MISDDQYLDSASSKTGFSDQYPASFSVVIALNWQDHSFKAGLLALLKHCTKRWIWPRPPSNLLSESVFFKKPVQNYEGKWASALSVVTTATRFMSNILLNFCSFRWMWPWLWPTPTQLLNHNRNTFNPLFISMYIKTGYGKGVKVRTYSIHAKKNNKACKRKTIFSKKQTNTAVSDSHILWCL